MSKIAFLGLGAMGSRMVVHLIKAGHTVTVWNRSPEAAEATAKLGARAAASPREAARGAEFILAMVTDDKASEAVWTMPGTGALEGIEPSAVAIEISTVSPGWLTKLAAAVESRGGQFLDAPVSGSLPQAETAKLVVFVGGDEQVFAKARPVLEPFSGAVHHIGRTGDGLAMKLAVNALLAIQVSAIAESIATLENSGIAPKAAYDVLSSLPIASPAGNWIAGLMVDDDFEARFPVNLVAKDLRYEADHAEQLGGKAPVLTAALDLFESLREKGFGGENISAVIRAYR